MSAEPAEKPRVFGVVANVLSDHAVRTGAKVWIRYCNGDAEHPLVVGCSKSGRVIEKYTDYKRLTNFRAKWCPEHLRSRVAWLFVTKEEADALAQRLTAMWSDVRYFNRDGTELRKEGISANAAFERRLEQISNRSTQP
jgi:hypothetical protein